MNRSTPRPDRAALKQWPIAGICALLMAGASQAQNVAQQPAEESSSLWLAASDRTLDHLRGGFDIGAGLVVSFGVSRTVYVNGQLMTSTSLQVGDISKLSSAQASALSQQLASQTLVVQNGHGNTMDPGAATIPFATYIQNTLNNQTIRNQTVIQATTNSLGFIKNLNLQSTLKDSVTNAVRSH